MTRAKHGTGKEYPHTDLILPLSAVSFSAVWVLDSFVMKFSERYTSCFPDAARIVLFAASEISAVLLGYLSHNALFSQKQESKLILNGAFAHVRHPLYLSVLLAYLGFILGSMSIISVTPWICFVILFDKMATYEEDDLTRIFGDANSEYKKRVPKWMPNPLPAGRE
jgi:protein-S-isoprenylcysteine O-methyltransferase Ste14